jgi:hypothetical protein
VVSGVTMVMNPPPDANRPPLTPTPEVISLTPEPVLVAPPPPRAGTRPPPVPAASLRSALASRLPPPQSSQGDATSPRPSPPPLPRKKG